MTARKILPIDIENDSSLPGRYEEGYSSNFYAETSRKPTKNSGLLVMTIVFVAIASGFFLFYFMNQTEIDSKIIQNTFLVDPEQKLLSQYKVGKYGSEHSHAAIAIFINDQKLDFSEKRFQLASKYIHFENHNSYLIHKHAKRVPLDLLFNSIGIKITQDCIILNYNSEAKRSFCSNEKNSLEFFLNGQQYKEDFSAYVFFHNDRILITYGNGNAINQQIEYLDSLEILDPPKKIPQYPGDGIFF